MQQTAAAASSHRQHDRLYICADRWMIDTTLSLQRKSIICFFCETIWNDYLWGDSEAEEWVMSLLWRMNAVLMGEVLCSCSLLIQSC